MSSKAESNEGGAWLLFRFVLISIWGTFFSFYSQRRHRGMEGQTEIKFFGRISTSEEDLKSFRNPSGY